MSNSFPCTDTSDSTLVMKSMQKTPLGKIFEHGLSGEEAIHAELCELYLNDYIEAAYHPTVEDEKKVLSPHQRNFIS